MRSLALSTDSKVQTGYVAAIVCIALVSIAAHLNFKRHELDTAWVLHTDQVIATLYRLLDTVTGAESAARGYVISGNSVFLTPFAQDKQAVDIEFQQLRQLTSDDSLQQRRLDQLKPLIATRFSVLSELLAARDAEGFDAARRGLQPGRGRALQSAIVGLVNDMASTESTLLSERERRTQNQAVLTRVTMISGSLLALAFVGFSLLAIRRDVAGRRRAEQALRQANAQLEERVRMRTAELSTAHTSLEKSERRFRAFIRATSDGLFLMNADWSEMQHLQGRALAATAEGAVRHWQEHYIPVEGRAQMSAAVDEAIRSKQTFQLEHRVQRADGTAGWTYSRAVPLFGDDGRITEWFGTAADITLRKQAEEKLYAQLARLKLLGEITRAIGERHDVNSIFQVVLRTLEEQLPIDFCCICNYNAAKNEIEIIRVGAKSRELALSMAVTEQAHFPVDQNGLGRCCQHNELVYEPDIIASAFPFAARLAAEGLRALVFAPLSAGGEVSGLMAIARREPNSFHSADCEFLRQLSEHMALAAHQSQLHGSLQRAYDELRGTQQMIMEQERLRVLGQMASGIAHDINNALSPAALYVQSLLETETSLSPAARSYLTITERAIQDVAGTIARLREFYRPREQGEELVPVNLNSIVTNVMDLTQVRWRDMPQEHGFVIEPKIELSSTLPSVLGEAHELRDALTNLVLNAIDAMPAGGRLTVRTAQLTPAGRDSGGGGGHVLVEIGDTGVGMSAEVRKQCLEPFFTTKGERGTGLGLAMVYGMAQRHAATLEVESSPGQGTTMRLTFPVARAPAPDTALVPLLLLDSVRVLLVDDDPLLLRSLYDILQRDGHDVHMAEGGQAGIDAFCAASDRNEPFAAVITDLGMPNVDGRAVASVIKAKAPATTVVLLTGWGHRLHGDQKPEYVDTVLNKPPRLAELRAALWQAATGVAPTAGG